MDRSEFERVKRIAQSACDVAVALKLDDNYNAADLSVSDVRISFDMDGAATWIIYVDEASPDASKLRKLITNTLQFNGVDQVDVILEW